MTGVAWTSVALSCIPSTPICTSRATFEASNTSAVILAGHTGWPAGPSTCPDKARPAGRLGLPASRSNRGCRPAWQPACLAAQRSAQPRRTSITEQCTLRASIAGRTARVSRSAQPGLEWPAAADDQACSSDRDEEPCGFEPPIQEALDRLRDPPRVASAQQPQRAAAPPASNRHINANVNGSSNGRGGGSGNGAHDDVLRVGQQAVPAPASKPPHAVAASADAQHMPMAPFSQQPFVPYTQQPTTLPSADEQHAAKVAAPAAAPLAGTARPATAGTPQPPLECPQVPSRLAQSTAQQPAADAVGSGAGGSGTGAALAALHFNKDTSGPLSDADPHRLVGPAAGDGTPPASLPSREDAAASPAALSSLPGASASSCAPDGTGSSQGAPAAPTLHAAHASAVQQQEADLSPSKAYTSMGEEFRTALRRCQKLVEVEALMQGHPSPEALHVPALTALCSRLLKLQEASSYAGRRALWRFLCKTAAPLLLARRQELDAAGACIVVGVLADLKGRNQHTQLAVADGSLELVEALADAGMAACQLPPVVRRALLAQKVVAGAPACDSATGLAAPEDHRQEVVNEVLQPGNSAPATATAAQGGEEDDEGEGAATAAGRWQQHAPAASDPDQLDEQQQQQRRQRNQQEVWDPGPEACSGHQPSAIAAAAASPERSTLTGSQLALLPSCGMVEAAEAHVPQSIGAGKPCTGAGGAPDDGPTGGLAAASSVPEGLPEGLGQHGLPHAVPPALPTGSRADLADSSDALAATAEAAATAVAAAAATADTAAAAVAAAAAATESAAAAADATATGAHADAGKASDAHAAAGTAANAAPGAVAQGRAGPYKGPFPRSGHTPRTYAQLIQGLARLRYAPPAEWLQRYIAHSGPWLAHFSTRDLAATLWALARMRFVPSGPWLDQFMATWLRQLEPRARRPALQQLLEPQVRLQEQVQGEGRPQLQAQQQPQEHVRDREQRQVQVQAYQQLQEQPPQQPQAQPQEQPQEQPQQQQGDGHRAGGGGSGLSSHGAGWRDPSLAVSCALVLWAVNQLRVAPPAEWLDTTLERCAAANFPGAGPQAMALIVHALARMQHQPAADVRCALVTAAAPHLQRANSHELALLLLGVAHWCGAPGAGGSSGDGSPAVAATVPAQFLKQACQALQPLLAGATPRTLVFSLVALAYLRFRPSAAWLATHEQRLTKHLDALPADALARVAAAWAHLRHQPRPATVRQLLEAFAAGAARARARLFSQALPMLATMSMQAAAVSGGGGGFWVRDEVEGLMLVSQSKLEFCYLDEMCLHLRAWVVWGVAPTPTWLASFAGIVRDKLPAAQAPQLLALLQQLAEAHLQAGMRPPPALLDAVAGALAPAPQALSPAQLAAAARALRALGHAPSRTWQDAAAAMLHAHLEATLLAQLVSDESHAGPVAVGNGAAGDAHVQQGGSCRKPAEATDNCLTRVPATSSGSSKRWDALLQAQLELQSLGVYNAAPARYALATLLAGGFALRSEEARLVCADMVRRMPRPAGGADAEALVRAKLHARL